MRARRGSWRVCSWPASSNWLTLKPDFHSWILAYGMGDLGGTASAFPATLEAAVEQLIAAGKVLILTHIQGVASNNGGQIDPASLVPFNDAIHALVLKYKPLPSPDLYAWFNAHPSELRTAADDTSDTSGCWRDAVERD